MGFKKMLKDVLNISKLPDSVQDDAQNLKATFDRAGEDIKEAHNGLIDELEEENAASNIGASSKEGASTVQAELDKLNDKIHVDYTELEVEVDDELNEESENAVQNKVITKEINAINGDLHTIDRCLFAETNYEYIEEPKEQTINLFEKMKDITYSECENKYVRAAAMNAYNNHSASAIFDSNEDTYYQTASAYYNPGVGLIFKKPIKAKKIKLKYGTSNTTAFRGLSITGSKDGIDFVTLYETTVFSDVSNEIVLQNTDFYQYYYLEVRLNSAYLYLYDFKILEWEGALFEAVANLDVPLSLYEEGKMINVEISDATVAKPRYNVKEFTSNIIPVFNSDSIYSENEYGIWVIGNGGNYNYKAFDGDDSTYWYGSYSTDTVTELSVAFVEKPGIKKVAIKPKKIVFSSAYNASTTIYGRRVSDGTEVALAVIPKNDNSTAVTADLVIETEDFFDKFYAKLGTTRSGESVKVYKFEIIEGTLKEGIFGEEIDNYFYNLHLNINNLGLRLVNTIVYANKKYVLMYNNEKWEPIRNHYITGSFTATSTIQTIELGFKPDLVICYNSSNNGDSTAISSSDGALAKIPRILSDAYGSDSDGKILPNGFSFKASTTSKVYYIAIKI